MWYIYIYIYIYWKYLMYKRTMYRVCIILRQASTLAQLNMSYTICAARINTHNLFVHRDVQKPEARTVPSKFQSRCARLPISAGEAVAIRSPISDDFLWWPIKGWFNPTILHGVRYFSLKLVGKLNHVFYLKIWWIESGKGTSLFCSMEVFAMLTVNPGYQTLLGNCRREKG